MKKLLSQIGETKIFLNLDYLEKYVSEHRKILVYSLIIAIICYGYEIFNFSLSIDEEFSSFSNAFDNRFLIEIGRWGTYLLSNLVFTHSLLPYAPFLFGVLGLAAASVILVNSFECSTRAKAVFSTVFITSPVHAYYLAFNTADPYFSIGLILAVISYLLATRGLESKNRGAMLLSVLLLAFSISVYQALFAVFVTLIMFHLLTKYLYDPGFGFKDILKRFTRFAALLAAGVALYKLADWLIYITVLGSNAPDGKAYLDSMQSWGKVPVLTILFNLVKNTLLFFTGRLIPGEKYVIPMMALTLIPYLFYRYARLKSAGKDRLILLLLLLLLILSPFILMYINGEILPRRTMMAFPLLLAMLWWLAYQQVSSSGKKIILVLAFALFVTNTGITTRLFYASWVAWQADKDMANRIYERICNLDLPAGNQPLQVAFIGKHDHPENKLFIKSEIFGASFFSWDEGNPYRMVSFINTTGINNLVVLSDAKIKAGLADTVKKLPCWPYKGSVCYYNNVVIVKLSDEPKQP